MVGRYVLTAALIILIPVPFLIGWLEGSLWTSGLYKDNAFLGDFFVWPTMFIIACPLMIYFHARLYRQQDDTLQACRDQGIVDEACRAHFEQSISQYKRHRKSLLKYAFITVFCLVFAVVYWTQLRSNFTICGTWVRGNVFLNNSLIDGAGLSYLGLYATFMWFVSLFIITHVVIDILLWSRLLSRISDPKCSISTRMFWPDGCAGLSMFGKPAITIYVMAFIVFMFAGVQAAEKISAEPSVIDVIELDQVFGDTCLLDTTLTEPSDFSSILDIATEWPAVPVTLTIAFLLLPLSILFPLRPIMQLIRRARQREEIRLSESLRAPHENLYNHLNTGNFTSLITEHKHHDEVYYLLMNVSCIPIERRFQKIIITSIGTPLALALFDIIRSILF